MYSKPTALLDEKKCKANIKRMAAKAKRNDVEFRPHFKTHQSLEIGEWFREEGVTKITVSSVDMAKYFAKGGWQDITIAFPVNILEIDEINELAATVTLNILVASHEIVQLLEQQLAHRINVFIKINIGNNRAGFEPDNFDEIENIVAAIGETSLMNFSGFLGHAGNSYACRNSDEILQVHTTSIAHLLKLKQRFSKDYPNLTISTGDTPTCSVAEDFSMVDEIRPGVFVFFDSIMLQIGCCAQDNLAAAIACPVVEIHKDKNELVIYGGRVHLASDILTEDRGNQHYGYIARNKENGWGELIANAYVKKISQEHGIVHAPEEFIASVALGDVLNIIPAHICTAANMFDHYLTTEGKKISRFRF